MLCVVTCDIHDMCPIRRNAEVNIIETIVKGTYGSQVSCFSLFSCLNYETFFFPCKIWTAEIISWLSSIFTIGDGR